MYTVLFVGFLFTLSSVQAIKYIERPSNTSVTIGDAVILRCSVSGKGKSKLYWERLGEPRYNEYISMDANIDPYGVYGRDIKSRYSVVGNQKLGEYHLKIERVNVDDDGEFACVYFENGYRDKHYVSSYVTVMWPAPEPPKCQVTYSISSQRVSLICLSRGGHPVASLAWTNGKTKLIGAPRKTNDVSLNIYQPGTKKFTESVFTCVATTPALETPRICKVLPVYINWHRNNLFTGDDVILTCKVFAHENDLAISWRINNQIVENSGKLTEFKDGKRKLIIYDLDITDNELKVTCIVRNRDGLTGNASEILYVSRQEYIVYKPTHTTTQSTLTPTTLSYLTTKATLLTKNKNGDINNIITTSVKPTLATLTQNANVSAIEGTVAYDNLPGPPFEVGVNGKDALLYKSFMIIVSVVALVLFILLITYGMRYRRSKTRSRLEKQRQLDEKCKESVPMTRVMSDMASESKRSDNEDSGISFGTEIESNIDCNTIDYKQRVMNAYPDLIINQDKCIDKKKDEPIYMCLNNCSDEESEDEKYQQKETNNNPVYMKLDREAEERDEVYCSVEIGNPFPNKDKDTHKHLYAVLESDSESCVVSDMRESDFCNSGYYSADSPCEYEELPESLPTRKQCPEPCAYAVTDLREVNRPLRPSLKQTLWKKLKKGSSNSLKDNREHISRRSLPKPSHKKEISRDNVHNPLTKTSSCPLVIPVVESARTPNMETLKRLRNAHFMANRPLISRPIFGRTVSTEQGIVVTDDYAELDINPPFSENQKDDTYESLDEYTIVKKSSPIGKRPIRLSPSFHGRELPKLKKSVSCRRCGSPTDRGFYSSSSEEEVRNTGPQTPPRILKNYKRIDQIRKDEARLKRASWPNRQQTRTEKLLNKSNAYSVVELD
ncbi:uncharacterized protein [Antedon mediterranea]|uniref:uncharacterized protein n=1 Tax=Antedon mediterranea TaxID=105859 RepID=UPI003AF70F41